MQSREAEIRAEILAENEAFGLFPPSEQYLSLAVESRLEMEGYGGGISLWGPPLIDQLMDWTEEDTSGSVESTDAFAPSSLEFGESEPSVFYAHEGGTVYQGQDLAKRRLTRFIETLGASDRLKCFLIGPAGTGKTALAKIIARRIVNRWEALGFEPGPYFSIIPSALESAEILDRFMIQLSELPRAIVFIDEVHDLGSSIKPERLFRVLDDTGDNPYITASGLEIQIPNTICWITATTDPGRLDGLNGGPLLRRIRPMIELERPEPRILADILAARDMPSSPEARLMMAERSDGLPWKAIEIYANARAEALMDGADEITPEHVAIACSDMGLDENGLETADRRVLLGLMNQPRYKGSEDLICSLAGVDKSFFRSEVKPRLISRGFLTVFGGQMLTEAGARAYGSPEFVAQYLEDTAPKKK
jgi:Holliday junction resolvasome RuvABC ATP-dependent DNA helicase subunit